MGCGADWWGKGLKGFFVGGICGSGAQLLQLQEASRGYVIAGKCRQAGGPGRVGVHCFGLQSLCLPCFGDVKCKT